MSFTPLQFGAVAATVALAVSTAWVVVRPYRRLAERVRPYSAVARVQLTRSVDVGGAAQPGPVFGDATLLRLFGPMVDTAVEWVGRLIATSSTDHLALRLRQAGMYPDLQETERVQEYRVRSLLRSLGWSGALGFFGLVVSGPPFMLLFAVLGFVYGVLSARARLDKGVAARREELQREASKRRLLMVIPIVVVLAPIVLLFIGGPIPQIIFGGN